MLCFHKSSSPREGEVVWSVSVDKIQVLRIFVVREEFFAADVSCSLLSATRAKSTPEKQRLSGI